MGEVPRRELALEAVGEARAAFADGVGLDGLVDCVGDAHEEDQFFAAGDGGVEEVALEHHVMLGMQDDDDGRVFAAL